MTDFTEENRLAHKLITLCEQYVGPRSYYLHNRVGGNGWEVKRGIGKIHVKIDNEALATFIKLKL